MFKLMKYEFRKTQATKLILLAIIAIAEIAFLIGLYGNYDMTAGLSIVALVFLSFLGVFVVGLESITILHRDMNTRQSYMLFMTPNSSYKILGAKVLECGLSILLAGAFVFALGTLDITLAVAREQGLNSLWEMIQNFLSHITINGRQLEIDASILAATFLNILTSWIMTIVSAYLAVVISAALLNGKKFNGLISFVLFLLLNWGAARILRLIPDTMSSVATLLVYVAVELVLSAIMYVVTAEIMERKLSV
ncbi:MAG: hypothetical protein II795_04735 [Firmicutes bacterium]|nr:hypothetical protein [Bacillota bacterium]